MGLSPTTTTVGERVRLALGFITAMDTGRTDPAEGFELAGDYIDGADTLDALIGLYMLATGALRASAELRDEPYETMLRRLALHWAAKP